MSASTMLKLINLTANAYLYIYAQYFPLFSHLLNSKKNSIQIP